MELQVQPSEFGLEETKAKELVKDLTVTLKERELLKEAFLNVSELEVTEENIPTFKELRLKIVKNRTQGIEKWHKTQKAFYLAGGRFVDAIKNKEVAVNQEMEEKLMNAEKYFENLEKERIAKLQKERIEKIEPYVDDVFGLDLGNMPDDVFDAYFKSKKREHEERLEAERKAEIERIENERLDKLERDRRFELAPYSQFIKGDYDYRSMDDETYEDLKKHLIEAKKAYDKEQEEIRKENERLKKEREAAEAKRLEEEKKRKSEEAKKEAEHQAQLKKEREAREELERKERQRKEAEAKAKAEAEAEAKRLEKAPIKEKLTKWVNEFEIPETTVDNEVSKEIKAKFESFKKWSINQVNNL